MTEARPQRVLLVDGETASVRGLHPSDSAEVLALHEDMSERDRFLRFFGLGVSGLAGLATHLSEDSGIGHAAAGCFLHDRLIGVAQYEVLADPADAEIAVVVNAGAKSLGVATLLLEHLVEQGRVSGVQRFLADVLAENASVIEVIADLGLPYRISTGGPEREVVILIDETLGYRDAVERRERAARAAGRAASCWAPVERKV